MDFNLNLQDIMAKEAIKFIQKENYDSLFQASIQAKPIPKLMAAVKLAVAQEIGDIACTERSMLQKKMFEQQLTIDLEEKANDEVEKINDEQENVLTLDKIAKIELKLLNIKQKLTLNTQHANRLNQDALLLEKQFQENKKKPKNSSNYEKNLPANLPSSAETYAALENASFSDEPDVTIERKYQTIQSKLQALSEENINLHSEIDSLNQHLKDNKHNVFSTVPNRKNLREQRATERENRHYYRGRTPLAFDQLSQANRVKLVNDLKANQEESINYKNKLLDEIESKCFFFFLESLSDNLQTLTLHPHQKQRLAFTIKKMREYQKIQQEALSLEKLISQKNTKYEERLNFLYQLQHNSQTLDTENKQLCLERLSLKSKLSTTENNLSRNKHKQRFLQKQAMVCFITGAVSLIGLFTFKTLSQAGFNILFLTIPTTLLCITGYSLLRNAYHNYQNNGYLTALEKYHNDLSSYNQKIENNTDENEHILLVELPLVQSQTTQLLDELTKLKQEHVMLKTTLESIQKEVEANYNAPIPSISVFNRTKSNRSRTMALLLNLYKGKSEISTQEIQDTEDTFSPKI